MKQLIFSLLVLSVASIDVVAAPNEPPANTVAATQTADPGTAPKPVLAETARLSENLIYSVNRTPEAVIAIDQTANSVVRRSFTLDIVGRPVAAIKSYWQQQIFSGRAVPPVEYENDDQVIAFIRKSPGAIGYVSLAAPIGDLKVIKVR